MPLVRELSPRQNEVLALLADGLTDREIGDRLGMARRTVTNTLSAIYDRIGVTNRVTASRWYWENCEHAA